jgi:hypothetical protein
MKVFVSRAPGAFDRIAASGAMELGGAPTDSGATDHFSVFCMPNLLPDGAQIAAGVLRRCENDYQQLCKWFGVIPPPRHFNVTLTGLSQALDGTGGAFHAQCASSDLYCDVKLNPVVDPNLSAALVVAEEVEVFSAMQNAGWDCGADNGEGLSRVLAAALYPGVTDGYATAAQWLDGGRPNWVDATIYTDQDPVANGCAVLFLNWMNHQLEIGWDEICRAGGGTLGDTYSRIAGKKNGWEAFSGLLNAAFPSGRASNVTTDNPFPL